MFAAGGKELIHCMQIVLILPCFQCSVSVSQSKLSGLFSILQIQWNQEAATMLLDRFWPSQALLDICEQPNQPCNRRHSVCLPSSVYLVLSTQKCPISPIVFAKRQTQCLVYRIAYCSSILGFNRHLKDLRQPLSAGLDVMANYGWLKVKKDSKLNTQREPGKEHISTELIFSLPSHCLGDEKLPHLVLQAPQSAV